MEASISARADEGINKHAAEKSHSRPEHQKIMKEDPAAAEDQMPIEKLQNTSDQKVQTENDFAAGKILDRSSGESNDIGDDLCLSNSPGKMHLESEMTGELREEERNSEMKQKNGDAFGRETFAELTNEVPAIAGNVVSGAKTQSLQCLKFCPDHLAWDRSHREKDMKYFQENVASVLLLQSHIRRYLAQVKSKDIKASCPKLVPPNAKRDLANSLDLSVERAATKIQATYRGFVVRKQLNSRDDEDRQVLRNLESTPNISQAKEGMEFLNLETNDSFSNLASAAIKIQAIFRGRRARKSLQIRLPTSRKKSKGLKKKKKSHKFSGAQESAAIRIQSIFRGYLIRKKLNKSHYNSNGHEARKGSLVSAVRDSIKLPGQKLEEEQWSAAVVILRACRAYLRRKNRVLAAESKNSGDTSQRDQFNAFLNDSESSKRINSSEVGTRITPTITLARAESNDVRETRQKVDFTGQQYYEEKLSKNMNAEENRKDGNDTFLTDKYARCITSSGDKTISENVGKCSSNAKIEEELLVPNTCKKSYDGETSASTCVVKRDERKSLLKDQQELDEVLVSVAEPKAFISDKKDIGALLCGSKEGEKELEKAALTIQCLFRGHKVRRLLRPTKEKKQNTTDTGANEFLSQSVRNEQENASKSNERKQNEKEMRAASIIQSFYRKHRNNRMRKSVVRGSAVKPVNDPNVIRAVVKIQRCFRLHQRKAKMAHYERPTAVIIKDNTHTASKNAKGIVVAASEREKTCQDSNTLSSLTTLSCAATVIQSRFRKYRAEKMLRQKFSAFGLTHGGDVIRSENILEATVRIQACFRGHLVRKRMKSGPLELANSETLSAVLKIQAHYRGYIARQRLKVSKPTAFIAEEKGENKNHRRCELNNEVGGSSAIMESMDIITPHNKSLHTSALVIQAHFRGFLTRKKLGIHPKTIDARPLNIHSDNSERVHRAAVIIQSCFKGYKTRKLLATNTKRPAENNLQLTSSSMAAMPVQLSKPVTGEEKLQLLSAVTVLQKHYRQYKKKRYGSTMRAEEQVIGGTILASTNEKTENILEGTQSSRGTEELKAAQVIQSCFRGYKVRRNLSRSQRRANKQELDVKSVVPRHEPEMLKAVMTIQARFRAYQKKKEQYLREQNSILKSISNDKSTLQAVITIQAAFRGSRSRKLCKQLKDSAVCTTQKSFEKDHDESDHLQAIILLQAYARGFIARRKYAEQSKKFSNKCENREIKNTYQSEEIFYPEITQNLLQSVIKIQACFRGFKSRKINKQNISKNIANKSLQFLDDLVITDSTMRNIVKIQSHVRGYIARKKIILKNSHNSCSIENGKTQNLDEMDEIVESVVKIQAHYRGFKTRKQMQMQNKGNNFGTNTNYSDIKKDILPSIIKIQSHYRGYRVRKSVRNVKISPENSKFVANARDVSVINAVLLIQRKFRLYQSHKGRKTEENLTVGQKKNLSCECMEMQKRLNAVTLLQAHFRSWKVRQISNNENKKSLKSITLIQASYRGWKTRKALASENKKIMESVIVIQAHYRGWRTRKIFFNSNKNILKSAIMIQAFYRGWKTRKNLNMKRNCQVNARVLESVTQIQAYYRGWKVRKDLKSQK